jgi:hypothetical protein
VNVEQFKHSELAGDTEMLAFCLVCSSILKMEAVWSSEASANFTGLHIPEDILLTLLISCED